MSNCCPLCGRDGLRHVAALDTSTIQREYRRVLGIEVRCGHRRLDLQRCPRCDLAFYTPQCPGDEDFYRSLQSFPWYYQADKPEYQVAAGYVTDADDVLEIGAGEGAFAGHLDSRSYRMLELNRAAVEVARSRGLAASEDPIEAYAIDHPAEYDVVCAFQVLEHVPNPREFIGSAAACLRSGGRLIFSVPADGSFVGRERRGLMNVPPHHMTRWSDRCLRGVAELFGMELVALRSDLLAPWHVAPYAASVADDFLAGVLRRPWQPFDPLFATYPVRVARAALTIGLRPVVGARRARLRGHSVTAVYRKP